MKLTLDDNLPSLTSLSERVDWRSDLSTGSKPEQHRCMKSIEARNQRRNGQDHQNQMAGDEVGRVQSHFDNLDDEFSSGLTENVRSQATVEPDTCPPSSVGLVVLEFTRQEDGNQKLEDESLHGDDGNHTQNDV